MIPESVADGKRVTCRTCGEQMYPRGPTADGRARHFAHVAEADTPDGGCGGSLGESDIHRKRKSLLISRLKEIFDPDLYDRIQPEVQFEAPPESPADHRRIDVLLELAVGHPEWGRGIAFEVQHKHEEKDRQQVQHDYARMGYSTYWALDADFEDDRAVLGGGDISADTREIWPRCVPPETEWSGVEDVADVVDADPPRICATFDLAEWLAQDELYFLSGRPAENWGESVSAQGDREVMVLRFEDFEDRIEFTPLEDHRGAGGWIVDARHYLPASLVEDHPKFRVEQYLNGEPVRLSHRKPRHERPEKDQYSLDDFENTE